MVACIVRDDEVAGSSPVSPTSYFDDEFAPQTNPISKASLDAIQALRPYFWHGF